MGPQCSPGCKLGHYTTPDGCEACGEIQVKLPELVSATLAPLRACGQDADCAAIAAPPLCGAACSFAVSATQTAAAEVALQPLADQWCGGGYGCAIPCAEAGKPACLQGNCRLVGLCDPLAAPAGSPCDDKNACTDKDICQGPGVCQGQPKTCDDGNPCTDDSCNTLKGCQFANNSVGCASEVPCSLGAKCEAGACTDSGTLGWKVALPPPSSNGMGRVGRLSDGSVAVAQTTQSGGAHVARLDAKGQVLWELASLPASSAADICAFGSGGVAVAGRHYGATWKDMQSVVTALDSAGKTLWQTAITMPSAAPVQVVERPEGGLVLVGGYSPAVADSYNAFATRLGTAGQVLGTTDLGLTADGGSLTATALKPGVWVVVATKPGVPIPAGDQSDIRFVRLGADGAVIVDQMLVSGPEYDRPLGVAAMAGGFAIGVGSTSYSKDSKSIANRVLRVDDNGKVLNSITLDGWLASVTGDGTTALVTTATGSNPMQYLFQPVTPAGALGVGLAIDSALFAGKTALWAVPAGDGGVYLAVTTGKDLQAVRVVGPGGACP
ncbi:MAG: hypothetical protein HY902_20015 [Deltaproteobacteria bacterium]|nr:hypothetical protein [Deltaproteobacteria bacterium]